MNTLREIATFVGMNKRSLRDMTNLVSLLTPAGRTSMRVMIRELESLPPVTLNVGIDTTEAVVPFAPVLNISATSGAVIDTRIVLYEGGKELGEYHLLSPAGGGSFGQFTLGQNGAYVLEVVRAGVQNTGYVELTKDFNILAKQAPPPPPPPPPPLVHPHINVIANGDGSFTVSGSLFLHHATVHIRVVDPAHANDQNFNTGSDGSGNLSGFKTPVICAESGPIYFSANDGRSDPNDHPLGVLWSNTVPMSC